MENELFQPLNPSFATEVKQSFANQKVMSLFGAEIIRMEPGVVEIALPFRADLTQQHGYMHAGVVTAIAALPADMQPILLCLPQPKS